MMPAIRKTVIIAGLECQESEVFRIVKIGELSRKTNTAKETIHHYIREGLLRKPHKIKGNMANYSDGHVEALLTIKELREHYHMPLSEIKKYLIQAKKRSVTNLPLLEIKKMTDQFLKHLERLFPPKVVGRTSFTGITGLTEDFLDQLEQWQVIIPDISEGKPVYSTQNIIIGRLINECERLGFGGKDGTDPQDMKRVAEFFRNVFFRRQREILNNKYGKGPLSADQLIQAEVYGDLVSLVIFYMFRQLNADGFSKFLASIDGTSEE